MIDGRRQLKRLYFGVWQALGGSNRWLRRIAQRDLVVVVNLHRVSPEKNAFWSPLHPRLFEDLLAFVTARFDVTTFRDLAASRAATSTRPALVLSFDDGYHDYVEYALPLLAKYGVSSNQNVIVDAIRSGRPPSVVRLSDFLGQAPRTLIDEIRLPGFDMRLDGEGFEHKARFGAALSAFLKLRPRAEQGPYWERLEATMSRLDGFRPSRMMTLADVRSCAGDHEIGAHSSSHDSFGVESDETFARDLDTCETFFREELQQPLGVYAFPNGSHRQSQIDLLFQRGVEHVLLVGEDFSTRTARVHKRFTFYAQSPSEVQARAVGFNGRPRRWVDAPKAPS